MNLSGAVAVVTGAGSGIGRELALQLGRAGSRLAINDSNEDALAETLRAVEEAGGAVFGDVFDVGCRRAMQSFAARVQEHYGQVDVVINNAGVSLGVMKLNEVSWEDFEWIINVNMWGVIHGTMAFLPMLQARPQASLVNVCSSFGLLAVPFQAPYCASKFAVRGFTDSLRLELMDSNICVTLVCPSQVKTNIVRNARHLDDEARAKLIHVFEDKVARMTPEQMAETILRAIRHRKERVIFGPDARMYDWVARLAPQFLIRAGVRRELRRFDRL